MKWQPAKPRTQIKVVGCGSGHWDEQDHCLDFPATIEIVNFRVTGTGRERIARIYKEGCANRIVIPGFNEKQAEHRIAAWLCRHACSFVLFDTKARSTVIGFEREDDAEASGRSWFAKQP